MTNLDKELNKAKYDLTSYQVKQILALFESVIPKKKGKKLIPGDREVETNLWFAKQGYNQALKDIRQKIGESK